MRLARVERVGRWLFERRGWIPVPLLAAMFLFPPRPWFPGILVLVAGELLRLLAVGHIGLPSRTRAGDVGVLVRSGPYGWVRNPLYIGNVLLFAGLGIVLWPSVLVVVPLLAVYYQLIVRWEEHNLATQLGSTYRRYLAEVPRWAPRAPAHPERGTWSLARAVRSERSTLLAIGVVLGLLVARGAVG